MLNVCKLELTKFIDTEPCPKFYNRNIKSMTLLTFKELDRYRNIFYEYTDHKLDYHGFICILKRFHSPLQCDNSMTRLLFLMFTPNDPNLMDINEYILGMSILLHKCLILNLYDILYDMITMNFEYCDQPFTDIDITPQDIVDYFLEKRPISQYDFMEKLSPIKEMIDHIFIISS